MATIGEQLKQVEDEKTRDRIAHRSNMLRKFVKEDLLEALKEDIAAGGSGHKGLEAPKEIRHLFAAPLTYNGYDSYTDPNSAYCEVWRELDAWAKSENLAISTGSYFDENQYHEPWDFRRWGGYLYISVPKPQPVKPTPPAPIKQEQGATITIKEAVFGILFAVLATFLLTFYSVGHW